MEVPQYSILRRPRRNRKSPAVRSLCQETVLTPADFVAPFFIINGEKKRDPSPSMPGIERLSIDQLVKEAETLHMAGVPAIAIFPHIAPELKNPEGSEAWNPEGLVPRAIELIKKEIPSLCIITDIALDLYTSHGHDGQVNDQGEIDNDLTLSALEKQAITYAASGCDILGPSDMMDGRVLAIRDALDEQGLTNTSILSYAAKYVSSFYTPYRHTVGSSVTFGDKRTYFMNPANKREAILEALLDEAEGADMLMVKPALPYIDVLSAIKEQTNLPVGAFHVSGEYSTVMAAHEKGWINAQDAFYESLTCLKRAGADFIFSYAISQVLDILGS